MHCEHDRGQTATDLDDFDQLDRRQQREAMRLMVAGAVNVRFPPAWRAEFRQCLAAMERHLQRRGR